MIRIALPTRGRLAEESINLLTEAGYNCKANLPRVELTVFDYENNVEFFFLRPNDLVTYVNSGILDVGITGRDVAMETGLNYFEILPLGFGKSKLCYAVPQDGNIRIKDFNGLKIATSLTNLVNRNLKANGVSANLVYLNGSVEISIKLGIADVIADVVETGIHLQSAGLKIIEDPILISESILISKDKSATNNEEILLLIERLRGIITARQYVVIDYNIPQILLDDACRITPGLESPTISHLNETGWLAVKAMVKLTEKNDAMDQLKKIGARGIIVTKISSCRF